MSHLVLGTAGHIDHGKSALVQALTGVHPDRLQEEQARGITIELGFADLDLGEGLGLSLVDVPGHERFVRHMVAGATGIDAVLLVVAADEGVMPQTREHLQICELLQVRYGLVALTKCDLIDPDLLEVVRLETREILAGSFLENVPLVPVSSRTGEGIDAIREELKALIRKVPARTAAGIARLPVDRSFTMKGFGTVVTGTLVAGTFAEGEEVEVLPGGKRGRIRGLQVHGEPVQTVAAGRRTAVNLQGLRCVEAPRGSTVTRPGILRTTDRVWAEVRLLEEAPESIRRGGTVRFHQGTAELDARIRVLDRCGDGVVHAEIVLAGPTLLLPGDRFILRRPMPVDTLGGGVILDNDPPRGREAKEERAAMAGGRRIGNDPVLLRLSRRGLAGCDRISLSRALGLTERELADRLEQLESDHAVVQGGGRYFPGSVLADLAKKIADRLGRFHLEEPLRKGMPREALRSELCRAFPQEAWREFLGRMEKNGTIRILAERLALPDHAVELSPAQKRRKDAIETRFREAGLTPPSVEEVLGASPTSGDRELLELLYEEGELIRLGDGRPFHAGALGELGERLREFAKKSPTIDVARFKDLAGVTRKNAIPLLEYLDGERQTRRVGDVREILIR